MTPTQNNIASFVLRFTQQVWQDAEGEPHVQWRGHIRHVQGDEEGRFTDFAEALAFIQHYLTQLTLDALSGGPAMSQERVVHESIKLWEQLASSYTNMMFQSVQQMLKQSQGVKEQMKEARNEMLKAWQLPGAPVDAQLLETLAELKAQVQFLSDKVESLERTLQETQAKKNTQDT